MNFFTFTKLSRAVVLLLSAAALLLVGCGGDDNGANSGGGGGGGDSRLVCADGEAWVECDGDGWCDGMVFKSNGTAFEVKLEEDGIWYRGSDHPYSTSGNQITVFSEVWTYSFSGDTLTIIEDGGTHTLTKTSGVNPIPLPEHD